MNRTYHYLINMGQDMRNHKTDGKGKECKNKSFYPASDMINDKAYVQYVCRGCGETFSIALEDTKINKEDNFMTEYIKRVFETGVGRDEFLRMCNR